MNISTFNYLESGLWFSMAALMLIGLFRRGRSCTYFRVMAAAFISFLAFAVSDIIEARTGAWWQPLWLLALKAACVVALGACYMRYIQIRRKGV